MLGKYLNPKNDFAFKRIFGREKNKDILITLINEVLRNQLPRKIIDLKFLKPVQEPEIASKKESIVDVFCQDAVGTKYIVEMQVANTGGFEERAQYYAYKAFVSQMHQGDHYKDLKEVIFLAFTCFDIFPGKKAFKSEHITLDKQTQERDLNKISFTFVDLHKFEKSRKKSIDQLTLEEKFYYFLYHGGAISPEDFKQLTREEQILQKAYLELESFYLTENEKLLYEEEQKRVRDNKAAWDFAIEESLRVGEAKGRREGLRVGEAKGRAAEQERILSMLIAQGVFSKEEIDQFFSDLNR